MIILSMPYQHEKSHEHVSNMIPRSHSHKGHRKFTDLIT
jgi:hypothetical protein